MLGRKPEWGEKEKKCGGRHHVIDRGGEREGPAQVTFEQRPEYRQG